MKLELDISARRTATRLALGLFVLLTLHLVAAFAHLVLHRRFEAFTVLFDMDLEANLPTFYNSLLFFLCAAIAWLKGRGRTGVLRRGWLVLTGAFLFLGVDEGSQIHEKFMLVTLRLINHGEQTGTHLGWLYYAWVIPYGLAAVLLFSALARWFFHIDAQLRKGLIIAGAVYLSGAVFLEMASGSVAECAVDHMSTEQLRYMPCEIYERSSCHLYMDPMYIALYTLEEVCEMSGLIICIHAILRSLERRGDTVLITLGSTR